MTIVPKQATRLLYLQHKPKCSGWCPRYQAPMQCARVTFWCSPETLAKQKTLFFPHVPSRALQYTITKTTFTLLSTLARPWDLTMFVFLCAEMLHFIIDCDRIQHKVIPEMQKYMVCFFKQSNLKRNIHSVFHGRNHNKSKWIELSLFKRYRTNPKIDEKFNLNDSLRGPSASDVRWRSALPPSGHVETLQLNEVPRKTTLPLLFQLVVNYTFMSNNVFKAVRKEN